MTDPLTEGQRSVEEIVRDLFTSDCEHGAENWMRVCDQAEEAHPALGCFERQVVAALRSEREARYEAERQRDAEREQTAARERQGLHWQDNYDKAESRVAEMTKALAMIADYSPDAPEVESWKWLARHLQDLARRALAPSEKA